MKRKISVLLAMILVLSTLTNVAVAEEINISIATNKPLQLSIEDAVKLATENSREMWKIDDKIREMKDLRRQGASAREMAESLINAPLSESSALGITSNYLELLLSKNNYYVKTAELRSEEIEKSREVLVKGIEIATTKLYYDVLVAEKTIEIHQSNLNKAEEQVRVANLKFNNGTATKSEVLGAELAAQQARTDLDSAIDDLNIAKLNLLNQLNLPFDTEFELTDRELIYVPTADINLDEAIEAAKVARPEILNAKNNLELQKIETHAYTAYYTSNLREHKAAKEKLKDAELNVPQAYKDVELDVRKSYLNLVKAERALVNAEKMVELSREAARVSKLLYENGMATILDVLNADSGLAQAEIMRYNTLVAYNLSKLAFENSNIIGSMK